jgi:amino acid permease
MFQPSCLAVTVIYILSLLIIGLNVPYDDPNLLGGSYDANTSPYVAPSTSIRAQLTLTSASSG